MKSILFVLAALLLGVAAGCQNQHAAPVSDRPATHPPGTNVGASYPGVNQGTQDTTATRSTDS